MKLCHLTFIPRTGKNSSSILLTVNLRSRKKRQQKRKHTQASNLLPKAQARLLFQCVAIVFVLLQSSIGAKLFPAKSTSQHLTQRRRSFSFHGRTSTALPACSALALYSLGLPPKPICIAALTAGENKGAKAVNENRSIIPALCRDR